MTGRWLDPAEQRRLGAALLALTSFILLVALFAFLVVPGWRRQAFLAPDRPGPGGGEPDWLDPAEAPAGPARTLPALDPAAVRSASPALLARGKALFAANCATCHGPGGKGDGPGGAGLRPPPRDLTAGAGWQRGRGLPALYRTLSEGLPGTGMAAFDDLPKADRLALAHWVRSLAGPDRGSEDPAALAALERALAAAPETQPGHIPLAAAAALLCREQGPPPPLPGWPAEPLVRAAVLDPVRAARTVAALRGRSPDAFCRELASQAPGNGFAPAVATWPRRRWRHLQTILRWR